MQALFSAIRSSAGPQIWSKGVGLTRSGKIIQETTAPGEIRIRISIPGRPVSPQVTLWLEEEDWSCDCHGPEDPCEHVAAAVIALKAARDNHNPLPTGPSEKEGEIQYHFVRKNGSLEFFRVFFHQDRTEPLKVTLTALTSGRIKGPRVRPTREDMTADNIMDGMRQGGAYPAQRMRKLVEALSGCRRVWLDGKPLECNGTTTGLVVRVQDRSDGVQVSKKSAPGITEIFNNGLALRGNTLHPLPHPKLQPELLRILAEGALFNQNQLIDLASRIIPEFGRHLPLDITAENLPESCRTVPYLSWESECNDGQLVLSPVITYGKPPIARVIQGRLVPTSRQKKVPVRLLKEEHRLEEKLGKEQGIRPGHPTTVTGSAAVRCLKKLADSGEEISGPGQHYFKQTAPLIPSLHVGGEGSVFEPEFLSGGARGKKADPTAVLRSWKQGENLVPLLDQSGWAEIPVDWLNKYGTKIQELLDARSENGGLPACQMPTLATLYSDMDLRAPGKLEKWQKMAEGCSAIPEARLPDGLVAQLRGYQRQGVNWLSFIKGQGMGALLADDMGLGKTLQTIAVLDCPALVICPTSVLYNWEKEIARFRPGLSVQVYHGQGRALRGIPGVVLTSYALLRLDLQALEKIRWKVLVLDEAQTIKNPDSQGAKAAYSLDATFRIALSGTPVENRLEDLWSLFHFTNRGLLGSLEAFKEQYIKPIQQGCDSTQSSLHKKIKPFVLRRLKSEVAKELPPRTNLNLYCELDEEEQTLYRSLLLASRQEIVKKLASGGKVLQALELLLRLRQAACHPGLLPGRPKEGPSSKLILIGEHLKKGIENNHKSLVFSQWTGFLDLMEPFLSSLGIPFLRIDGNTIDRSAVVSKFQNSSDPLVLLLSLKAAGTGLNLTAAEHVLIADPWWNPAVEEQAADRAHRIGQKRPVIISRLIAKNTVEEKILALKERKKGLAESVVPGKELARSLRREDLMGLLED